MAGIDELSLAVLMAFHSFQNDAMVVICNNISHSDEVLIGLLLTHSDVGKAIQFNVFTALSYCD